MTKKEVKAGPAPEVKPKTIEDLTETELKAIAYEQLVAIENSQRNLKAVNAELDKRNGKQVNTVQ